MVCPVFKAEIREIRETKMLLRALNVDNNVRLTIDSAIVYSGTMLCDALPCLST